MSDTPRSRFLYLLTLGSLILKAGFWNFAPLSGWNLPDLVLVSHFPTDISAVRLKVGRNCWLQPAFLLPREAKLGRFLKTGHKMSEPTDAMFWKIVDIFP